MLDPHGRREVLSTVGRLNRRDGLTVVLITHFMSEAVLADRVVVMDRGRVVMAAPPEDVFQEPERIEAIGLGVPPAVDLRRRLLGLGHRLPADILTLEGLADHLCR